MHCDGLQYYQTEPEESWFVLNAFAYEEEHIWFKKAY